LDLQAVSVLIGLVALSLVVYQVWRNYHVGPQIKMIDARYRGPGGTTVDSHNIVPETWTYMITIRNDGSRSGEIRNSVVELYECEPSNLQLGLDIAHGTINGTYEKGKPVQIPLRIAYKDRGPDTLPQHKQVTKLVAVLKWNREVRNGFSQDARILRLIPGPPIQD